MPEKIGLEAIFKTDAFKKGLKDYLDGLSKSEKQTKKTGDMIPGLIGNLAPLGAMFGGVAGGVKIAAEAFQMLQKFVAPTVERAKDVRDFARAIGSTATEASKLIEAADDVKISTDTLQQGLIAAVRKGIDPSIDSIASLSDEYRQLAPGLERTKFLTDRFGRAGAELAPLMELGAEGIRELGDAAEEMGIVLDEQAIAKTREYEIAMDDLEDTFMAVKQEIAMELVPALTDIGIALVEVMNIAKERGDDLEAGLMPSISAGAALAYNVRDIEAAMDAARVDTYVTELGKAHAAMKDTADAAGSVASQIANVAAAILDMTEKAFAAKAVETLGKLFESGAIAADQYYQNRSDFGTEFLGWTQTQVDASIATSIMNKAAEDGILLFDEWLPATQELIDLVGENTTAQENYNATYEEYLASAQEGIGDTQALAVEMDGYRETIAGTNTQISEMATNLAGVPTSIPVEMSDLVSESTTAATQAELLKGYLDGMPDYVYTKVVTEYISQGGGNVTGMGGWNPYYARGGPISAGQPAIVGDGGRPEVFVPGSDGYIFPSLSSFRSAMGGAGNTTNTRNFNMNIQNLNANPQTVQRSFEMMKLLTR